MSEVLNLLVCSAYYGETEAVRQRHAWTEVVIHTYPPVCVLPKYRPQIEESIRQLRNEAAPFAIVGSCPMMRQIERSSPSGPSPEADPHSVPQCFYSFTNQAIVDYWVAAGSYVVTPGWLEHWQQHLHAWGFDQPTASAFFHECVRGLVLLDTGTSSASAEKLAGMGQYLGLPVERVPIGLDFFDLHLSQIVSRLHWAQEEKKFTREQQELKRSIANYAMMIDLLPTLSQPLDEAGVIEQIIEMIRMLFSPNAIHYIRVDQTRAFPVRPKLADPLEDERFTSWVLEDSSDYAWIEENSGFYLRLTHQGKTIGALRVAQLGFPQYIRHYLNLSLSVAAVCGLAIFNTRMTQRLKEAEQTSRREKEIADTMCEVMSELAAQYEKEEMLRHILLSLYRIIPYADAAILLSEENCLRFQTGLLRSGAEPTHYQPKQPTLAVNLDSLPSPAQILTDPGSIPGLEQLLSQPPRGAWMGIPLQMHRHLIGFLSVAAPPERSFSEHETILAQSFANAIESAHILKEATTQAATDALTGAFNRRSFFSQAQEHILKARFGQLPLAVLMVDIDHFKRINDYFGHPTGDRVLALIAAMCAEKIRSTDILGRYGGEEFVLLLPNSDHTRALRVAERLRQAIADLRIPTEKGPAQVTASVGVACLDESTPNLETLLKRSDLAMYLAKQRGRNRVITWDTTAAEPDSPPGAT